MEHPIPKATAPQVNYLEILFNDLGFDTRHKRLGFLIHRNIDVRHLDEMTVRQAQAMIAELKEMRDRAQEEFTRRTVDEEDD